MGHSVLDEKRNVLDYFQRKAKDYDLVDNQYYWKLSDLILLEIFKTKVLDPIHQAKGEIKFFDAGAGTGRWSIQILTHYEKSLGTLVDFSEPMLNEAKRKIANLQLSNKVEYRHGDLDELQVDQMPQFNVAFSFHNVIGFVKDPKQLINKLARAVSLGGYVVVLAPNIYHNIYFNIVTNQIELLDNILVTNKGKFTRDMPAMHMFTPDLLKNYFESAGLQDIFISGFPSAIYPHFQETQLGGSTKSLVDLLQNEEYFNQVLEIEKSLSNYPDIAARGNQLVAIGRKV